MASGTSEPSREPVVRRKTQFLHLGGRLTQAKMEDFFREDTFFIHATPGFFANVPLVVASG